MVSPLLAAAAAARHSAAPAVVAAVPQSVPIHNFPQAHLIVKIKVIFARHFVPLSFQILNEIVGEILIAALFGELGGRAVVILLKKTSTSARLIYRHIVCVGGAVRRCYF